MELSGKVALVTGASRGVGKGCALELGAAGVSVYVTGRSLRAADSKLPGSLEATCEEIGELGGRGVAVQCDHRDDEAVTALFERVVRRYPRDLDAATRRRAAYFARVYTLRWLGDLSRAHASADTRNLLAWVRRAFAP